MNTDRLNAFYEKDAHRFWDPRDGLAGRDRTIYPLMQGLEGRVLEYGAGSGSLLLALAREERFSSLTGVDISSTALSAIAAAWEEISKENELEANKVRLLRPTDDHLPEIEDESVDVLLSLDTIEHVLDPFVVLDELRRVAAPGATFIISVPNYGYIKHCLTLLLGRQPITGGDVGVEGWREAGWDGYHLHTFTYESLNALLLETGWVPTRWSGYGDKGNAIGLGHLRRWYPSLFSGALTVVCQRKEGM